MLQRSAGLEREMRAVGALSHPNIVQAHDAGEVNGIHYLAMEFVRGKRSLRSGQVEGTTVGTAGL